MNKLSPEMPELQSMNITADNITKLKSLFPEAFNENGIDFDVLKQLLGENVDEKEERYGLNLEVLKLLQKSYAGKVKLIYIDPPYNTGKDFVYSDNFQDNMKNYLEMTGQTEDGVRITTNAETSGRYHTDWLNMIYPRLKLARNLLKEDGVIFISIDDTEVDNLKKVCSEIFGEENFVANIVWQKKYSPQNDATYFSDMHDHILVYAKQRKTSKNDSNGWNIDFLPRSDEQNAAYKNPDNDPRGVWKSVDLSVKTYSKANDYSITTPSGRIVTPPASRCWQVSEKRFVELCKENKIWFGENGNNVPSIKRFLTEVQDGVVPTTWWSYKECGHNQEAKQELKKLMEGESVFFDTPKPLRLLDRILHLATTNDKDCIILDFFAGSGTTAHATLNKNIADSGSRRYIAVQLPEKIDDEKYYTISELTKERLRRAGKKVREDNPEWKGDVGFRVFKLDTSNIRPWEATAETLSEQLDAYVSPILEGRSEEDLLTELMLKRGIDLSVNVEVRQFDGLTVSCVDGGKLFTCFTRQIPASSVEALTKGIIDWHKSLKAGKDTVCYFLDDAFENNVAKTNLCAILEQHGLTNLHSL